MDLLCLCSSPNTRGVSSGLARYLYERIKPAFQNAALYYTRGMHITSCKACMRCKKDRACVLNDDLRIVLDGLLQSDTVILAAPVYAADINVDMKVFMERCHSLVPPPMGPIPVYPNTTGKTLIFACSQGSPEDCHGDILVKYQDLFRALGVTNYQTVRACNVPSNSEFNPQDYPEPVALCDQLSYVIPQERRRVP